MKETIVKQWGGLDIIVVNVGSGKSVLDAIPTAENFDSVFSLNFDSVVYTVREFYPLLKISKGNFIFISSIAGLEAFGAPVDYAVAKTAMIAFEKKWTPQEMDGFLIKPKEWVKGTKMAYAGLKDPKERASLILYMNNNMDNPLSLK